MDETLSPITEADLYAVFREVLISPDTAADEDEMLPLTTVREPVTTESKQRTAPPKKTAALR